jgi:hypothetical protein
VVRSRPFVGALYAMLEQLGVRGLDAPVDCRIGPSVARARPKHGEAEVSYAPVDFTKDEAPVSHIRQSLRSGETYVLAGSPVYNLMTYYVLENCGEDGRVNFTYARAEPEVFATALKVHHFLSRSELLFERRQIPGGEGGYLYEEYFLLQKITNWTGGNEPVREGRGSTIFLCAGTSVAATAAALETLAHWERLVRDFGMGPFAMLCRVHTEDRELSGHDFREGRPWHVSPVWHHPEPR